VVYPRSWESGLIDNLSRIPPGRPLDQATTALCDYAASNSEGTGVVRRFLPHRIADVTDGLSNTALVGDKQMLRARLGQLQVDDDQGYCAGFDHDTVRHTDQAPAPDDTDAATVRDDALSGRFGSSHPARFNLLFADGSVHALAYTIDPLLFTRLGNIADGQVVSPDW
jgi:prepilin-type processing-associated H-X9-DG protein